MNEFDEDIVLLEVNELAKSLYLMSGFVIPNEKIFSRHNSEYAEYCYNAAAVAYFKYKTVQSCSTTKH